MAQKINIAKARITFKNFSGRPTDWNKKGGARDFAVVLDNYADVKSLIDMGFPVKYFKKKEETDPDVPFLKVKVNFRFNPDNPQELMSPHIYVVKDPNGPKTKDNLQLIKPETAPIIDSMDIDYCDIVIRPYYTNVQGTDYVVAYLDTMYINREVDPFEAKYINFTSPEEEAEAFPIDDFEG